MKRKTKVKIATILAYITYGLMVLAIAGLAYLVIDFMGLVAWAVSGQVPEDGRVYEECIENIERDEDEEYIDEVYQWYAMEVSEFDVEYLNKEFNLNIFYSDTLDLYILPVYHFGTAWDMLNLKGGYSTD